MSTMQFEPQDIATSKLEFAMLVSILGSLVFLVGISLYCIYLSNGLSPNSPVPLKVIMFIAIGTVFVFLVCFLGITSAYTHSIYEVKGDKFRFYNGYYPFPISLPIHKLYRIQPVRHRSLILENRIGLRLYFDGFYCLLPYHIDVFVKDEQTFLKTILTIHPAIAVTDEVITSRRITL